MVCRKILVPVDGSVRSNSRLLEAIKFAAVARQFGLEPEPLTLETLGGDIAPTIVAQAKEWAADLIVMGGHGYSADYDELHLPIRHRYYNEPQFLPRSDIP